MGWHIAGWWKADRAYFRGCRLYQAGKPGEAAKAFDVVIEAFPKHAQAYVQRALALSAAGRASEAVRAAERAAKLVPKNHAPLLFLGRIHYDAGHLAEARKAFSAAARLDPANRLVQAYTGLAMLAQGQMEEGAQLLAKHLRYAYAELEGRLLTLAEQFLWQHRDQARPLERQLTPDEGGREEGPAGLGLRLASAVRKVALYPLVRLRGRAAFWMFLGEEAMSVMDFEGAINAFRRAEEAGADPEAVAVSLGHAYLEARKPEAAVAQFGRLSEESAEDPGLALLIGAACLDAGQYNEARAPLELAAARFTRDFVASYFRGLCDIAIGQPKASTRWFTQAAERLNPQLAEKRLEEMLRVMAEAPQPGQRNT